MTGEPVLGLGFRDDVLRLFFSKLYYVKPPCCVGSPIFNCKISILVLKTCIIYVPEQLPSFGEGFRA